MSVSKILSNIEDNKKQIKSILSDGASAYKLNDWLAEQACMESQVLYRSINTYPSTNYKAIENHSEAMKYIINGTINNTQGMDKDIICKIHKLFSDHTPLHAFAGTFTARTQKDLRKYNNEMQSVFDYTNRKDLGLFDRAYHIQYKTRQIQPFGDHNKRTGRYAMNFILTQEGYTPILFNQVGDKELYLKFLLNPDIGIPMMYDYMIRTQEQVLEYLTSSKKRSF